MRNDHLISTVFCAAITVVSVPVMADVYIFVNDNATGAGTGQSWDDAYIDLQTALEDAADNVGVTTQIWVAAGTYYPSVQRDGALERSVSFALLNNVELYGGFAGDPLTEIPGEFDLSNPAHRPNLTVLSGDFNQDQTATNNAYNVVTAGPEINATAVLDGFRIAGGYADRMYSDHWDTGGGLLNRGAPVIRNCTFNDHWGFSGAAVANWDNADPWFESCLFEDNTVNDYGGAMLCMGSSTVSLRACRFQNNQSVRHGGGMYCADASIVSIRDCEFRSNIAQEDDDYKLGGGLFMFGGANASEIVNTKFIACTAHKGGGAYIYSRPVNIVNCTFLGNNAQGPEAEGGGLWVQSAKRKLKVHNCLFSGNKSTRRGGGMYHLGVGCPTEPLARTYPELADCTFSNNEAYSDPAARGGGFYSVNHFPEIYNSIFWGNRDERTDGDLSLQQIFQETYTYNQHPSVIASCVEGGWSGAGAYNIDHDPLFQSPLGQDESAGTDDDDLHLQTSPEESPCIDSGLLGYLPPDCTDLDEDDDAAEYLPLDLDMQRRWIGYLDMGAYEEYCEDASDCSDSDACTCNICISGVCTFTPRLYGDADCNDIRNLWDILAMLRAINEGFYDENLDIEPCAGNGVINTFDVFAVLDAIAGEPDPCCGE